MSEPAQWRLVDEGWGRKAVDFATLSEPANCREYVALHQQLGVGAGDRLLDIACGAGLAVELAAVRGADVRRHRRLAPAGRGRPRPLPRRRPAGRRHARAAVGGRRRSTSSPASAGSGARRRTRWPRPAGCSRPVAASGSPCGATSRLAGRVGAGAVHAGRPSRRSRNQAAMVALGRPGAGEELLAGAASSTSGGSTCRSPGSSPIPRAYARALASTGPAYEAIQAVGEEAFHAHAIELAARAGP